MAAPLPKITISLSAGAQPGADGTRGCAAGRRADDVEILARDQDVTEARFARQFTSHGKQGRQIEAVGYADTHPHSVRSVADACSQQHFSLT